MARYCSEIEVLDTISELFHAAASDREVGPRLAAVKSVVAMHCCDPQVLITLRLAQPLAVWAGAEPSEPPDLHLYLASDDAVELLSGHASVAVASARGRLQAQGAVSKLVALAAVLPLMARLPAPVEPAGGET